MTPFVPGCFGKLPVAADFIGHHLHDHDALALERWLQEGVGSARERFGTRSDGLLRQIRPTFFILWWTDPRIPIIGVLLPGKDRSGRNFPFAVFFQARASVSAGILDGAPLLFERFLSEAARIGAHSWEDIAALIGAIDGLRDCAPVLDAGDPLKALIGTTTIQSLIRGKHDRSGLIAWTAAHLHALLPPPGNHSKEGRSVGLRLPVPASGGEGRAVTCFWLGLIRRKFGTKGTLPTCFWTLADDGGEGYLDVYFRPVDSLGFLHLLDAGFESDGLFPVEEGSSGAPRRDAGISPDSLDRLGDPMLPLIDALDIVAPIGRRDLN